MNCTHVRQIGLIGLRGGKCHGDDCGDGQHRLENLAVRHLDGGIFVCGSEVTNNTKQTDTNEHITVNV